ncbi:MAG: glycosyltransferase family 39 protein [Polyangia bacterium]
MKRAAIPAVIVAALLAASNLLVTALLDLGDAEALYVCYGRHLQLSYLDHPPLIGWAIGLAERVLGPTAWAPRSISLISMLLAVLFGWLLARDLYGERAAAWSAPLLLATPAFAIGTVAAAPDALLAAIWMAFCWQLCRAAREPRSGTLRERYGRPVLLGVLAGLGFLAKHTGVMLVLGALVFSSTRQGRRWLRRPVFWLAAAIALALASPVLFWNASHGWAGAQHRLVWTQGEAGFSLRNLGALLGGQLLYIGPLTLVLIGAGALRAWRTRHRPEIAALLAVSLPTLVAGYLLVLWSPVAEPHWPAVGYLPLLIAAAGAVAEGGRRLRAAARWAVGLGAAALAALHVLVSTPLLPALMPAESYEPRYDLANELRGWEEAAAAIRDIRPRPSLVVAAHYTLCAQLERVLWRADDPPVRCVTDEIDDFDFWYEPLGAPPPGSWLVTDNRFGHEVDEVFGGAVQAGRGIDVVVERGGRAVRRFELVDLVPPRADDRTGSPGGRSAPPAQDQDDGRQREQGECGDDGSQHE